MGFRFWRRIKIAPGISINLSKSGASVSVGPRGAKVTVGPKGSRRTIGIPGTGLFYTTFSKTKRHASAKAKSVEPVNKGPLEPENRLTLNFFKRFVNSGSEEAFLNACKKLSAGDEEGALKDLRKAAHLADGAFLAGYLSLKKNLFSDAERFFKIAYEKHRELGKYFSKYRLSATMNLPITSEISAHVKPNVRGVLLALVEIYQRLKKWEQALESLKKLRRLEPDDVVVKLSLAELVMDVAPNKVNVCRNVVRLAENIENESEAHAALLLYKGKALRNLGLLDAAKDVLTMALRKRKDRSPALLKAIRYERALVYEDLGLYKRALTEFHKLYGEDPDYEDVAKKIKQYA